MEFVYKWSWYKNENTTDLIVASGTSVCTAATQQTAFWSTGTSIVAGGCLDADGMKEQQMTAGTNI